MKIKGITNIEFFDKGSRGFIYTGKFKDKKVAIKVRNPKSDAMNRINNEINFLKILNEFNIGPKLIMSFKNKMVYEFQEGAYMIKWWKKASLKQKNKVLKNLMDQCFTMDLLGINKEEMLRPFKNVIIKKYNVPILIDFERCHYTEKVKNVSQLVQYVFKEKMVGKSIIPLVQKYKKDVCEKNYQKIIKKLFVN